jgi:predicted transcriptional regulator
VKRAPSRTSHVAIAELVARLASGPSTVIEIAEQSGLSEQSIRGYIRAMRRRKVVYIAAWEDDLRGRQTLAAYAIGDRPNAAKKPPRTRSQIAKSYRARRRDAALLGICA